MTILTFERPEPIGFIKLGVKNSTIESDIFRKLQPLVNMREITSKLLPTGKTLSPVPVSPDFFHGKFVIGDIGVNPCTRVTIPMPDPTKCVARVIEPNIEALLPESIQLITAAETAANYQDI